MDSGVMREEDEGLYIISGQGSGRTISLEIMSS